MIILYNFWVSHWGIPPIQTFTKKCNLTAWFDLYKFSLYVQRPPWTWKIAHQWALNGFRNMSLHKMLNKSMFVPAYLVIKPCNICSKQLISDLPGFFGNTRYFLILLEKPAFSISTHKKVGKSCHRVIYGCHIVVIFVSLVITGKSLFFHVSSGLFLWLIIMIYNNHHQIWDDHSLGSCLKKHVESISAQAGTLPVLGAITRMGRALALLCRQKDKPGRLFQL